MKILVISDIHGNAEALSAVLDAEQDAESTIFLGDTVLPGPQPNETIELMKGLSGTLILGNHDVETIGTGGFEGWPADWLALNDWVLDALTAEGYDYIRTLKPAGEYEIDGMRMCLHHGVLPDKPAQGLPDTSDERLAALAEGSDCPFVLFGHSHIQFRRTINRQEYINPGSVGQSRCGRRVACYGVFQDGQFEHRHVDYDPKPWLDAVDAIAQLDDFPDFRDWLKKGFIDGYGIGENEPWTRFAKEGYL